jgi:PAS domain S-box-containing protein
MRIADPAVVDPARSKRLSIGVASAFTIIFFLSVLLPSSFGVDTLDRYLPIHTITEIFAVAIAFMVFALGWNTPTEARAGSFFVIAVGFLAVGLFDLAHLLSFPGMPAFVTDSGTDKAIYFWLAARFTAALVLWVAAWRSWGLPRHPRDRYFILILALVWVAFVYELVLFRSTALPPMFAPNAGLTSYKIGSEYVIVALHGLTAWWLWSRGSPLAKFDVNWLASAVWVMGLGEMFFTRYEYVTDFSNLMGHVYKVIAYALAYHALFVNTVREPHRRLSESQARLQESEARYGAIVGSAMDAVILTDERQRIVVFNRAAETMFGVSASAIISRRLERLLPERLHAKHDILVRHYAKNGATTRTMGRFARVSGVRADGQEFPAEAAIAKVNAGDRYYLCVTLRDVTERVQANATIAHGEARYRTLVTNIPGMVYRVEVDAPWHAQMMSDAVAAITGYPAEVFLHGGRTWADLVVPDDIPILERAVVEMKASSHVSCDITYRIHHRDGSVRWLRDLGRVVPGDDGQPRYIDGVAFDVTDEVRSHAALEEMRERLATVLGNIPGAVYRCELNVPWCVAFLSEGAEGLTGYPAENFLSGGLHWADIVLPEDLPAVDRAVQAGIAERRHYEIQYRIRHRDGGVRWVQEKGLAVYGPEGVPRWLDGAVFDITVQKEAEFELQRSHHELDRRVQERTTQLSLSHQLLDAVFDTTHVLIAVLDTDMNFIRVNRAYAATDGKAPSFYIGKNHFALFPNAENEVIFHRAAQSGETAQVQAKPFEYEHNPERGLTHWDWTLTPIKDAAGTVTSLVLSLLNVTPRIAALETLSKREQELSELNRSLEARVRARTEELSGAHEFTQAVLNTVGSLVVVLDRDGRIVRFNQACERVTGYSATEAVGRCVWDFLLLEEEREPVKGVFASLRAGNFPNAHENFWLTRSGDKRLIVWSNTALTDGAGEVAYVIATGMDITDRKRAEEERLAYAQSQRDTLVREVHHRIKNNLQGVVGLLRQHVQREPALRLPVEAAVGQVGTMALVHGLQAQDRNERVVLCELTETIARQVVMLTGAHITPRVTRQVLRPVPLAHEEAVPVALIINELLFNAVKHGAGEEGVSVTIDCANGWATIRVINPADSLPSELDIEHGRGLSTGLSLVRALLPTRGASVRLWYNNGVAIAELKLAPPWVELPEDCH